MRPEPCPCTGCVCVLATVRWRAAMGICSLLTAGGSTCFPRDVDKMSLCDGKGCLLQMVDRRRLDQTFWASTLARRPPIVIQRLFGPEHHDRAL